MYNILKRLVKIFIPKRWLAFIKKFIRILQRLDTVEKNSENLLWLNYNLITKDIDHRTIFRGHGFKIYSQNGEDGLLLYIFSKISTTNCYFVEFGIGDGRECNTANLSINFGWDGLLIDGKKDNVIRAKEYYRNNPKMKPSEIKIVECFITAENINKVLLDNNIEDKIDLLSIDIDGNDYWVWKAITAIEPRVVVIEYNASLGHDKSLAVKYAPNFDRHKKHHSGWYHGASLTALTKLANAKGYILVGCESQGVNAFFVRKEIASGKIFEVSAEEAFYHHLSRVKKADTAHQFERIKHLDFEQI